LPSGAAGDAAAADEGLVFLLERFLVSRSDDLSVGGSWR